MGQRAFEQIDYFVRLSGAVRGKRSPGHEFEHCMALTLTLNLTLTLTVTLTLTLTLTPKESWA